MKDNFYLYAEDWKNKIRHPNFHWPPNIVKYKNLRVKEEKIVLGLKAKLTWELSEGYWDKEYIREYGGKVRGTSASCEDEWGDIEITKDNKNFNDKHHYTIEVPERKRINTRNRKQDN